MSPEPESSSEPELSLEYASSCLMTAITLAENYKAKLMKNFNKESAEEVEAEKDWRKIEDANYCNPSMPVSMESLDKLLSAAYASYSYVSLQIGDDSFALKYAQKLLQLENLSHAYM